MLISRLGSVAKSGRKTTQVTHAAEVGGLVFGGTVETSIEATHAAQVGGLTFGATASPIIEVAMGGEVRGLTFAAEYDDRNLVQPGGVVEGLTFAANVDPVVGVSHAAQVGGLVFGASVTSIIEDADAAAYLNAVEAADGQTLEPAVRAAINDFVVGCKADGIWTPIKAACILAGARTLNGALVPLVGSAPTNNNFVPADYNRKTGLIGNGSSKYLDTNRANNADPQNNKHASIYVNSLPTLSNRPMIGMARLTYEGSGATLIYSATTRLHDSASSNYTASVGFIGVSRNLSASYQRRNAESTTTLTQASTTPSSKNIVVFADNLSNAPGYSNARISFYSIGEALDLALLKARVATLMSDLNSAIP